MIQRGLGPTTDPYPHLSKVDSQLSRNSGKLIEPSGPKPSNNTFIQLETVYCIEILGYCISESVFCD